MRKRQDGKKFRQEQALERQGAYDKLTDEQKIDLLDKKLGKGVGATKQRERLTQKED